MKLNRDPKVNLACYIVSTTSYFGFILARLCRACAAWETAGCPYFFSNVVVPS